MLVGANEPAGDAGPRIAAITYGRVSEREGICRRYLSKVRAP